MSTQFQLPLFDYAEDALPDALQKLHATDNMLADATSKMAELKASVKTLTEQREQCIVTLKTLHADAITRRAQREAAEAATEVNSVTEQGEEDYDGPSGEIIDPDAVTAPHIAALPAAGHTHRRAAGTVR